MRNTKDPSPVTFFFPTLPSPQDSNSERTNEIIEQGTNYVDFFLYRFTDKRATEFIPYEIYPFYNF